MEAAHTAGLPQQAVSSPAPAPASGEAVGSMQGARPHWVCIVTGFQAADEIGRLMTMGWRPDGRRAEQAGLHELRRCGVPKPGIGS